MRPPRVPAPVYFGRSDQPLFGCYHEPRPADRRNSAVVICQPVGHEYINCHRALRQLAVRLCEVGFPVLRFDYYGTGDSSGDAVAGILPRWLEDIATAISEIRHRTCLVSVCMIGLRLGGTLAMITGAQRGDVESLVLWDPVVSGKHYLGGLLSLQKEMLRFRPKTKDGQRFRGYNDILGFPVSDFLYAQLGTLNLLTIIERPANSILVIQSPADGEPALREHLSRTQARLEYQRLDIPQIWLPTVDGSLLVPSEALKSVVAWTCRTHS